MLERSAFGSLLIFFKFEQPFELFERSSRERATNMRDWVQVRATTDFRSTKRAQICFLAGDVLKVDLEGAREINSHVSYLLPSVHMTRRVEYAHVLAMLQFDVYGMRGRS